MKLICPDCGEKDEFEKKVFGMTKYTEIHFIDSGSEFVEADGFDEYDSEITSEEDPICMKCKAKVKDLGGKEYLEFLLEHTKKDGKWSKEIIPEKDRDETLIEREIAKKV